MRQSLVKTLDLKVDGAALTPTNIRSNLYYLANHELFHANRSTNFGRDPEVERGFQDFDAKGWDSNELIKILQTVLLDAEAYLWWLEQLAIVTNGHYTAPMEISEELAHRILEEGLTFLKEEPEALRHLATSPSQLMQMFWEINESDTEAWAELKIQIGEELLTIVGENGDELALETEQPAPTGQAADSDWGREVEVEADSPELVDGRPTVEKQESPTIENAVILQVAASGGAKSDDGQRTVWQWKNSEIQAQCVFNAGLYELKIKLLSESEKASPDRIEIFWVNADKLTSVGLLKTSGEILSGKLTAFTLPLREKELKPDKIVLEITRTLDGVERILRYELPLK